MAQGEVSKKDGIKSADQVDLMFVAHVPIATTICMKRLFDPLLADHNEPLHDVSTKHKA